MRFKGLQRDFPGASNVTLGEVPGMGVVPKTEYERLCCITETQRTKSEQVRLDLERHVADHGC
jgi:hypothetical protein